jgi:hypothetical protein
MKLIHCRAVSIFLVAALTGLAAGVSPAADTVKLTGDQEVPAVTTSATGTAMITVKPDKSVAGTVTTKGIDGIAAHIHLASAGKNGPPIIPLAKASDSEWSVPEGSKLTDEQYASYKAGDLYVNVHSAEHKGGEIRGQLKP